MFPPAIAKKLAEAIVADPAIKADLTVNLAAKFLNVLQVKGAIAAGVVIGFEAANIAVLSVTPDVINLDICFAADSDALAAGTPSCHFSGFQVVVSTVALLRLVNEYAAHAGVVWHNGRWLTPASDKLAIYSTASGYGVGKHLYFHVEISNPITAEAWKKFRDLDCVAPGARFTVYNNHNSGPANATQIAEYRAALGLRGV